MPSLRYVEPDPLDPLLTIEGRWRQVDRNGVCLWPRTFVDDDNVRHAVNLSFDDYREGPVVVCTGHRTAATGVEDRVGPLTCLACLVRNPPFPQVRDDEG